MSSAVVPSLSPSMRSTTGEHHDRRLHLRRLFQPRRLRRRQRQLARLHAWMFDTPEENPDEAGQMTAARAFIIGRNMFGPVRGEWDRQWNGWRGEDPPFHAPVFVLTHHARGPQPVDGGTTYYFATGGIESALTRAKRPGTATSASRAARPPSTSTSPPA